MTADVHTENPATPLSGLHLLLTYACNYECDHCFVWGSPSQSGTMTIETIEHILAEAEALGTIEWIYFEGGEAFLYYQVLRSGILKAKERGFKVGIVTNAYWATADTDAVEWLQPLAGSVDDLSISSDAYHGSDTGSNHPEIARRAARQLGIPVDFISVAEPEAADVPGAAGKLPAGESAVLYRGRAAALLASSTRWQTSWRAMMRTSTRSSVPCLPAAPRRSFAATMSPTRRDTLITATCVMNRGVLSGSASRRC
jgi:hypothetical protein